MKNDYGFFRYGLLCTLLFAAGRSPLLADDADALVLISPQPWQVVQRTGFVPQYAHEHQPGGPALGFADVVIRLKQIDTTDRQFEYRVLNTQPTSTSAGDGESSITEAPWTPVSLVRTADKLEGRVRINAGGWYRLEVRCLSGSEVVGSAAADPFGVGEVFVIAGQSYATNCNDEQFRVQDAQLRISAFNHSTGTWQIANDPQPAGDASDGGSIWPVFGDLLLPSLRVPVGFVNVAVGGTSTAQWMPDGPLHKRLRDIGPHVGPVRAVFWQQGESDVIGKVSTDDYVKNVTTIRDAAAASWGFHPVWFTAKSTLHPTVYNEPAGEGRIREGIRRLCLQPGFLPGPDTDVLGHENRGDPKTRRHFTGIGQRNAAAMWFASVMPFLNAARPDHELSLRSLHEMHLLEPAWKSPIVWKESSVLLQMQPDGEITARLAFAAAEILEVAAANGSYRFVPEKDFVVAPDGRTLVFRNPQNVVPIRAADFFPPKDSPNSYRHRVSNPEQNLLYNPGKWFHERNVEISYRRRDNSDTASPVDSSAKNDSAINVFCGDQLPRTIARLTAGQSLTIGVSGDSISTGLDASALSAVPPFQQGYADLVAAQLQETYGSEISLANRAVSGWSVANGVQDLDELLKSKPHLMIVAYGMNDVGRRNPGWFLEQTQILLQRVREASPETEIILVSPMLGHSEWIHTPREMFAQYRDQLKTLTGPGIVLTDVTHVWQTMLEHKHDFDLTGNGLNHPNDFGHRLYAQAILAALVNK